MRDEIVDDDTTVGEVGDALRDAEVDTAHGVWISQGGAREGARPQYEFDAITSPTHDRIESLARHLVGDLPHRVVAFRTTKALAPHTAPPDLDRSVAGAGHVSE